MSKEQSIIQTVACYTSPFAGTCLIKADCTFLSDDKGMLIIYMLLTTSFNLNGPLVKKDLGALCPDHKVMAKNCRKPVIIHSSHLHTGFPSLLPKMIGVLHPSIIAALERCVHSTFC